MDIVQCCCIVWVCFLSLSPHSIMSIEIHYNHLMYSSSPLYIWALNALIEDLLIFIGVLYR